MAEWRVVVPAARQHVFDEWHIAPAVRAGGVLYCSGVLGAGDNGTVPPEPEDQYHQVFKNLDALLAEAGASFTDVVDILSFHLDLADQIATFTDVKDQYISKPYPAWTAVEVAGLGAGAIPGALVEVKVTAVV